jgi:hypothetical protein
MSQFSEALANLISGCHRRIQWEIRHIYNFALCKHAAKLSILSELLHFQTI